MRKKRCDEGASIFNSQLKRDTFYTPYNYYKKWQRKDKPGEVLCDKTLRESFNKLAPAELHKCQLGTQNLQLVAANIVGEIKKVLQKTNGSISWERMAAHIAGGADKVQPISKNTLANYVMATENFYYVATRTLPQCTNERTKKWRMKWAIQFHIFWEGAKMIATKCK